MSGSNELLFIGERVDQCVFAKHVNHSWDSSCVVVYAFYGFRRKNRPAVCPRDSQTFCNVASRFLQRQCACPAEHRNPLAQLTQVRKFESFFEFRLARWHNLQQFLARSLKVGEEADFLEHLRGETLRLVHDQYCYLPCAVPVQEPTVEPY